MENMKLYYETINQNINVVLEVNRPIEKKWGLQEIDVRSLLSENLEKIIFNNNSFKHFLSKIFNKTDFRLNKDRISKGNHFHYHCYKGVYNKLSSIRDYCKIHNIKVKKGIDDTLKSIINF